MDTKAELDVFGIYSVQTANYEIREEVHDGKEYIVVPIVMMVEGVHHGNRGPVLHQAQELSKFVETWNGRPITVGHPEVEGHAVSANASPEVHDQVTVGHVFNANYNNGLRAEAWLDVQRLAAVSPLALTYIYEGQPIDVSVGVFNDTAYIEGEWRGETYESIASNYRPDHLALLPGERGACSWDDGCGIRLNKEGGEMDVHATVTGMETKRSELGMSVAEFYAVPRDPPSDSKLPIFDAAHVRNAMARFSQTQGLSSQERATAKRKIIAKAHKFDIDTSGFEGATNNSADVDESKQEWVKKIIQNYVDLGYRELLQSLQSKLDAMDVPGERTHYIQEVYDDYLIYSVRTRNGGETLFKRGYTINAGGIADFGEDTPVEVRRKIEYVTMKMVRTNFNNNKKEDVMANDNLCCEAKIDALIANPLTNFSAEDKEWMSKLSESQVEKLAPKESKPKENIQVNQVDEKEVIKTYQSTLKELDDFLPIMPSHVKATVEAGVKLYKEKRKTLMQGILDNSEFTEEELEVMSDDMIEKINKSINVADYSGQGAGGTSRGGDAPVDKLLPPGVGVKKEKEG